MARTVALISSSPRRDGNSALLLHHALKGVEDSGGTGEIRYLDDYVREGLRDCRSCRRSNGACSIDDGYEPFLTEFLLLADGWIIATPLYFYGIPGGLKNLFDRLFCYISAGYPGHERVIESIGRKRVSVLFACEEQYPALPAPVISQMQEMFTYLGMEFAGYGIGVGNSRGEVARDPADPLAKARSLGEGLFTRQVTNYTLASVRSNSVWGGGISDDEEY